MKESKFSWRLGCAPLPFRKQTVPGEIVVKVCPLCSKPHYGKADNHWKLYFSTDSGAYFCFRCGSKGSFFDFKQKVHQFATLRDPGCIIPLIMRSSVTWVRTLHGRLLQCKHHRETAPELRRWRQKR